MNLKQLRSFVDNLFTRREWLGNLWQEQAQHFYPERADFTYRRSIGTDFAADLTTSYPLLTRREMAAQFGVMLHSGQWFYMDVEDRRKDHDAKLWLDWANGTMRRAMYDRAALFRKSSEHAFNDYATFGQYVKSIRLNRGNNALLYRVWHLRDCVWIEDDEGGIPFFARRWKPMALDLKRQFPNDLHTQVTKILEKQPDQRINCLHVVCQPDYVDFPANGMPWVSTYIDCDHGNHLLEQVGQRTREYVVARWQTVSGSQYAFSPATVAALPDARLIQAIAYTLLEAGEKAVNPPMVATHDVIKSPVEIFAGGMTWLERDYDERLGNALRPLTQDYRQLPIGLEMMQDIREQLHQAFYLNKLTLPERAPEMTAYEIGQRVQEYVRGALPLFEPMEDESNTQECELTFETLLLNGGFGPLDNMPKSLRGADVQFKYRSPLHEAIDAQKAHTFREAGQMLAEAVSLDPGVAFEVDARKAFRDAMEAINVPEEWMRSQDEAKKMEQAAAQQQHQQQMMDTLERGSQVAKNVADANAASMH